MFLEIILILGTLFFIYHYWALGYWKRKGVPQARGKIIFGNVLDVITWRKTIIEIFEEMYKQTTEGMIGFYYFYNPALLVKDPQLIKNVLIKDFNSFCDPGFEFHNRHDFLFSGNPFVVRSLEKWKAVRSIHTPLQTSLKLKELLPKMYKVVNLFTTYLEDNTSKPLNAREICSCFTIDNVALCAFGTEPGCFTNADNGFKKYSGVNLFNASFMTHYATIFGFFPPFSYLHKILPFRMLSKETENFFMYMVKKTKEFRKEQNVSQNDFFDYLLKLSEKRKADNLPEFTLKDLACHCMTLYADGTETSGIVLCLILLELANHPEAQEKLREEVTSSGQQPDQFSFDKIHSLDYLDMIVKEVLRVHSLVPFLSRTCARSVTLGGVRIEPGTKVFLPVSLLHKEPGLFPRPMEFLPERFSKEESADSCRSPTYSFGDGPRMCVGVKFALTEVKLALISILLKFKVVTCSGKSETITHERSPFLHLPSLHLEIIFEKL